MWESPEDISLLGVKGHNTDIPKEYFKQDIAAFICIFQICYSQSIVPCEAKKIGF
jgi:hypothetical protein